jgi:hypothetical protein
VDSYFILFATYLSLGSVGSFFDPPILLGNATFAGATAAITANVVLFAYIFVAWRDDQEEQHARKEKKAQ